MKTKLSLDELFVKGQELADSIWNGEYYFPGILAICVLGLLTGENLIFMFVLVLVTTLFLLFSDDLMTVICPVFCVLLLSTKYYRDYTVLLPYVWLAAIPILYGLLFNLIYYRRPFKRGNMLYGYIGVSIALILGGVGVISADNYFAPVSLYYMLCLGVGMALLYLLCISRLQNERSYNRPVRLAVILYCVGIVAATVIYAFYIANFQKFLSRGSVLFYKPRNFVATVLLISLPTACIFVKNSYKHIGGVAYMYLALLLSGSRSALLFGTMLTLVCAAYIYFVFKRKSRKQYNWKLVLGIALVALAAAFVIPDLYASRLTEEGALISGDETRVKFIWLGIADFLSNPFNGVGIGNFKNIGIFPGIIPGSIVFYHNFVLQIMASMGFVGIAAYSYVFYKRFLMIWNMRMTNVLVFGISYAGVLMMSLTNPGIFCPFPEAAILVIMFAVIEKEYIDRQMKELESIFN